ncbi:MAG: hypothetical protein ACTHW1_06815 [Ancrocorticia sp.]|uniref:hypothetical protein n=1 Tax=Ancrocorticia sp. TaxID=2593684 RepID=UPI003F9228D2
MSTPDIRPDSPVSEGSQDQGPPKRRLHKKVFGIGLGIVLAVIVYFLMPKGVHPSVADSEIVVSDNALAMAAAVAVLMGT